MKDSVNVSNLLIPIVHLSEYVDTLFKSVKDSGASFCLVHDLELASRCLSDALNIVKNDMKDVH